MPILILLDLAVNASFFMRILNYLVLGLPKPANGELKPLEDDCVPNRGGADNVDGLCVGGLPEADAVVTEAPKRLGLVGAGVAPNKVGVGAVAGSPKRLLKGLGVFASFVEPLGLSWLAAGMNSNKDGVGAVAG